MAKQLSINFLWHMHQPYYRDDISGEFIMPWVFLHAIKDYYDMPWYLSKFPNIKATFNLVPSLLIQLKYYESPDVNDRFLKSLRKPVEELSSDEREYIVEYLFFSNVENMIKPLPRYYELYSKKDRGFNSSELLDLEVLFILSWCGNYLRESKKEIKTLLKKSRGYTQSEKIELLNSLSSFIKEIIPYYKKLMQNGQIDVSTTPFNHPISPLLLDMQSAKLANPNTSLPKYSGSFYDDAILQIDSAREYYETIFGKKADGFWPAEGSVSYDFLEILSKRDIRWAASDEEVLYKSGHFEKGDIYKNNTLMFKDGAISLFFRDKELSDLIGFSYSAWDEKSAVEDFIGRLLKIYESSKDSLSVNVILDGENAWEHYFNNASSFFDRLYSEIDRLEWLESRLFKDVKDDKTIPLNTLHEISPGSWINGDFNIWVGHREKNSAWELLFQTKEDFEKLKDTLLESEVDGVKNEFLIAQSSDWFWWYGDDHHTDLALTFDELFRTHLMNIYTIMNKKIPSNLLDPIVETNSNRESFIKSSTNRITAKLDGKITHFYEWLGSGVIELSCELSSMSMQNFTISKIYFGCDKSYCYIALIGDFENLFDRAVLNIEFSNGLVATLPVSKELRSDKLGIDYITDEIMEIRVDKVLVENMELNFKLFKDGKLLQLLPLYSKIEFDCLKDVRKNWYI